MEVSNYTYIGVEIITFIKSNAHPSDVIVYSMLPHKFLETSLGVFQQKYVVPSIFRNKALHVLQHAARYMLLERIGSMLLVLGRGGDGSRSDWGYLKPRQKTGSDERSYLDVPGS